MMKLNKNKYDYYTTCRECQSRKPKSKMTVIENIKFLEICKKCKEFWLNKEVLVHCTKCGRIFHQGKPCICSIKKASLRADRNNSRNVLLDYDATEDYTPFTTDKDSESLLYGIELEILSNRGYNFKSIEKTYKQNWLSFKWDGSIGEYGFEIVTKPMSLDYILNNLADIEYHMLIAPNELEGGVTSMKNNLCGIHIHLNKEAFTTFHLFKFMKFFENEELILYISNREIDQLAKWSTPQDYILIKTGAFVKDVPDKHYRINVKNPNTVEVRVFNGSLSLPIFMKNIEFTRAVFYYSRDHNIKDMTNIEKFIHFIKENSSHFKYLNEYIECAL